MKVRNIVYLTDEVIYIKNNKLNEIIKSKIKKGIIKNGRVINKDKFINAFTKIINDNKINNNIFGSTIKIIVNSSYSSIDINNLKEIFTYLNYRKVLIDYESKYYKLKNNNVYLSIYDNYVYLYYLDEYKKVISILIPRNMFVSKEDFYLYIKYRVKNREIMILGSGELLEDFFNEFEEKYHNKTFMFSDNETHIFNLVK